VDGNMKPVIAVDIGGTKIVAALVSRQGHVVDVKKTDTLAWEGFQPVANRLFSSIDTILRSNGLSPGDLSGISVAVASPIDMANGLVTTPPNLPGWRMVPLRDMIREKYGISSYLINDAKAAAVAEFLLGSGKGIDNMLAVTLGTGIGCGIIIGGRLYLGESGAAGEVGHMTIDSNGPKCACGSTGCWEVFASGAAMEREAARRLGAGMPSSLHGSSPTGREIVAAARSGDDLALGVLSWSSNHIGAGLANLINIFNPRMIVLGGGLSAVGDLLLLPAISAAKRRAFPLPAEAVSIVPSALGNDAGMLGAAAFAFRLGQV
jgi:glucokinase